MSSVLITRTVGTSSSASEPQRLGEGETGADLEIVLPEHAEVAVSSTNLSSQPLILRINRYAAMIAEFMSDMRWAKLLSDSNFFENLDRMADEALAEDDAGLTLDLDELL